LEPHKSAPLSLKIVAALFILSGISSIIEVIISLIQGRLSFNFGVLGVVIGIGLLHFSRTWRICALIFIWIALICLPLVALVFMFLAGSVNYIIFWQNVGPGSRAIGVALAALMFGVALWQYRVLTRPDIRRLFRRSA
jgi:cytochrome c oxidase subunit IV